jgi:hypothetical protein
MEMKTFMFSYPYTNVGLYGCDIQFFTEERNILGVQEQSGYRFDRERCDETKHCRKLVIRSFVMCIFHLMGLRAQLFVSILRRCQYRDYKTSTERWLMKYKMEGIWKKMVLT